MAPRYRSTTIHGATISDGNTKVADCPNVSLMPILSCPDGIPCAGDCYDCKSTRRFPSVRQARMRNWELVQRDPDSYFAGIREYLDHYAPRYFRWHVGGDIPDQDYYREMCQIAREHPKTHFLAFTKNHALDFRGRPSNLNIVLSMWPNWGNSRKRMPRAWMQDGSEDRIPEGAIQCSGSCEFCGVCWHLKAGQDVYFLKH